MKKILSFILPVILFLLVELGIQIYNSDNPIIENDPKWGVYYHIRVIIHFWTSFFYSAFAAFVSNRIFANPWPVVLTGCSVFFVFFEEVSWGFTTQTLMCLIGMIAAGWPINEPE